METIAEQYRKEKITSLPEAEIELQRVFDELFAANPAIIGITWTQRTSGFYGDSSIDVSDMEASTDENFLESAFYSNFVDLYPTEGGCIEGIDYEYLRDFFSHTYEDSVEDMLVDIFGPDVRVFASREGFTSQEI